MHEENNSRRGFIKKASISGLAAISIPAIVTDALAAHKGKTVKLQQNDVILFQGDSITDARRKRDDLTVNGADALGNGYAFMAASDLLCKYAGKSLNIYNKGISGNKVYQLAERWDTDALELKPNVLSVLIGVNDFWHTLVRDYKGTIKTYKDDYTTILDRTKQKFPDVKFIIGEPFAVTGIKSVDQSWFPAFKEYQKAAHEIADKYDAAFIPYQSIFDKAQKEAPGSYWTYDGVHPTIAGNRLMANAWLEMVKG